MIARHLHVGRDRPTTLSALAERMGITRREAEHAVRTARLNGEPILSDGRGLWATETPQEAREWAQRQRSRAIHLMETAQALERWADRHEQAGQARLWEDAA